MKYRATRIIAVLCLSAGLQPLMAQDADTPSLVVIDLRPDNEKEGNGLAALSGKCNENVYRIADVASDPLKVDLLKEDLAPLVGTGGKTLTVLNWSIYYNKQVQKAGGLKGFGVQGYSVPTKDDKKKAGSKCSQKESAGGWYQASEITSVYFPIISEFTGTFSGKAVNVRVVYSPRTKLPGKFEGEAPDTEALIEAVHQTSEAVATAILQ